MNTWLEWRPGRAATARWAPVLLLAAAAGCGGDGTGAVLKGTTYPVTGHVLKADGKPVTAGRVVFVPSGEEGAQALAEISSDGSYMLKTSARDEGAVPGTYKVRIEPAAQDLKKGERGLGYAFKYTDEDTSELLVTVQAQPNTLDLRLSNRPR
jgi:hypothetical protein